MQEPRNLSWTHYNKVRRFPLMFDSTAVSTDGLFTIPDDLIVSIYLSCNEAGNYDGPGRFYIGGLTYYTTGFTLSIYYSSDDGSTGEKAAETSVDISDGNVPDIVKISGLNPLSLDGIIVLGGIEGLLRQPAGEWSFTPSAATIDPFCIRYTAKELSELYVQSHGRLIGPFHGTVTFAEGENITLDVRTLEDLNCLYPTVSGSGTEVVVNAADEENAEACIRTINGVKPDLNGNIVFTGRNCLDIHPEGEHTLVFDDTCAEPCCSCSELAPIDEAINELSDSITQLTSRMETLRSQQEFMLHSLNAAG